MEKYLKLFTFVSLGAISDTMIQHSADPSRRIAQHLLASEVLELVHGAADAEKARKKHEQMRKPTVKSLKKRTPPAEQSEKEEVEPVKKPTTKASTSEVFSEDDIAHETVTDEVSEAEDPGISEQRIMLAESKVLGLPFAHILHNAGLAASRGEGTRMINAGGVYVARRSEEEGSEDLNFVPVKGVPDGVKVEELLIDGQLVLRLGKWKVRVMEVMEEGLFDSDLLRA